MIKSIVFLFILFNLNLAFCQQKTSRKTIWEQSKTTGSKSTMAPVKKHETFNTVVTNVNEKLKSFIPKRYEAIAQKSGDLNLDKLEDYILVLRKASEETTSNYNKNKPDKRPVLLLLGQKDGSFKLAYKNENVAYCIDCGGVFGDPFDRIAIKNGFFLLNIVFLADIIGKKSSPLNLIKPKTIGFYIKNITLTISLIRVQIQKPKL